jgi:glucose-1-phosphate thymidylyltransferase
MTPITRSHRKGIVLAGGAGTRLWPVTLGTSKQLLPVYDKPMIYYPISVLMLAGIQEIAVITTAEDQANFMRLLGDGSQWGLSLTYIVQPQPDGLAQAYILAREFLNGAPSALVLGDNIFFGQGLQACLTKADTKVLGGTVFGYHVADPERYGIVSFDANGRVKDLVEKPAVPQSNYAVTGLYFLDGRAPEIASQIRPSARGELEIVDLLTAYLHEGTLDVETLGRGYAWLDTGTCASLLDAGNFVRTLTERQGMQVGSPDEIAFKMGWIDGGSFAARIDMFGKSAYGKTLKTLGQDAAQ